MPKLSAYLEAGQDGVVPNTVDPKGLRTLEPVEYVWTDQDREDPERRVPWCLTSTQAGVAVP
jgi:hypothetical protein